MIGLRVSWNAMDSQIELQWASGEKEHQLIKNSWNSILITFKMNWKILPRVVFGTMMWQIWETILVQENMPWNEEKSMPRGSWTQAKPHFQWFLRKCWKLSCTPYVAYKSVHLYPQWVAAGPPGTRYNWSKSGQFDETIITDWFFRLMLLILRKQEGKKLLISDNLSLQLSWSVIDAYSKHSIAFVCLFPNATYLLQPLDVTWLALLKKLRQKVLEYWKKSPKGLKYKGALPKEEFIKFLKKLVEKLHENAAASENLLNRFHKCGLFPL